MKRHLPLPSQRRLQELFTYSVLTGTLYRKVGVKGYSAGQVAGSVSASCGYTYAVVDGTRYAVHRIVWTLVTGEDPGAFEVDHIDGQRANNAWHNLRLALRKQNACNQRLRPDNTSGLKGASWDRNKRKWQAKITVGQKQLHLGRYDTPEEAHAAYLAAAEQLHGEFARAS